MFVSTNENEIPRNPPRQRRELAWLKKPSFRRSRDMGYDGSDGVDMEDTVDYGDDSLEDDDFRAIASNFKSTEKMSKKKSKSVK